MSVDSTPVEIISTAGMGPHSPASPPPFLGAAERSAYARLKTPKRRGDWAAGRLAAKRLVAGTLGRGTGPEDLRGVEIRSSESGEPLCEHFSISISHAPGVAAAALAPKGLRIGVDVEAVASRGRSWLETFAHESELSPGLETDPVSQTALWTMKEAVSKLLGTGLSVDLWDIRFLPRGEAEGLGALAAAELRLGGRAERAWRDLGAPEIARFSRVLEDFDSILTVAWGGADHGS